MGVSRALEIVKNYFTSLIKLTPSNAKLIYPFEF